MYEVTVITKLNAYMLFQIVILHNSCEHTKV